jgi:hypothetical protein
MNDSPWQSQVFDVLKAARIAIVGYVPDAGHAHLIQAAHADPGIRAACQLPGQPNIARVGLASTR